MRSQHVVALALSLSLAGASVATAQPAPSSSAGASPVTVASTPTPVGPAASGGPAVASVASVASTAAAPLPDPPGTWKRTAGPVLIAAGVGLLLLSLVSYAEVDAVDEARGYQAYVSTYASTSDACDAASNGKLSRAPGAVAPSVASDACTRRATWHVVELVTLIAGVAATGTGITLTATAPARPARTSFTLSPHGTTGGTMDVLVRF